MTFIILDAIASWDTQLFDTWSAGPRTSPALVCILPLFNVLAPRFSRVASTVNTGNRCGGDEDFVTPLSMLAVIAEAPTWHLTLELHVRCSRDADDDEEMADSPVSVVQQMQRAVKAFSRLTQLQTLELASDLEQLFELDESSSATATAATTTVTATNTTVGNSLLKQIVRLAPTLTELTLRCSVNRHDAEAFFASLTNLRHLTIQGGAINHLTEMLRGIAAGPGRNLRSLLLVLPSATTLTALTTPPDEHNSDALVSLFDACGNLETLDLYVPSPSSLLIYRNVVALAAQKLPYLSSLSLMNIPVFAVGDGSDAHDISRHLDNMRCLRELKIKDEVDASRVISVSTAAALTRAHGGVGQQLVVLDVIAQRVESDEVLRLLMLQSRETMQNLKTLKLELIFVHSKWEQLTVAMCFNNINGSKRLGLPLGLQKLGTFNLALPTAMIKMMLSDLTQLEECSLIWEEANEWERDDMSGSDDDSGETKQHKPINVSVGLSQDWIESLLACKSLRKFEISSLTGAVGLDRLTATATATSSPSPFPHLESCIVTFQSGTVTRDFVTAICESCHSTLQNLCVWEGYSRRSFGRNLEKFAAALSRCTRLRQLSLNQGFAAAEGDKLVNAAFVNSGGSSSSSSCCWLEEVYVRDGEFSLKTCQALARKFPALRLVGGSCEGGEELGAEFPHIQWCAASGHC